MVKFSPSSARTETKLTGDMRLQEKNMPNVLRQLSKAASAPEEMVEIDELVGTSMSERPDTDEVSSLRCTAANIFDSRKFCLVLTPGRMDTLL
jgi:hypothetical protein